MAFLDDNLFTSLQVFAASEDEIISADSFMRDLAYANSSKLLIAHFDGKGFEAESEVELIMEPKLVRIMHRKIFVTYWSADHVDTFNLVGANRQTVRLGVPGIHSLRFFAKPSEEQVFVVGTSNGTVVAKIFDKTFKEATFSTCVMIGKMPVTLREVNAQQFAALSDESSMVYFSNDFRTSSCCRCATRICMTCTSSDTSKKISSCSFSKMSVRCAKRRRRRWTTTSCAICCSKSNSGPSKLSWSASRR